MMRKITLIGTMMLIATSSYAGGLLTNTNQHVAFDRMLARGASTEIDAVYSNPAGLGYMDNGWYFSLNNQSVYQTRDIEATFPLFPEGTRKYTGTASVPVDPSILAAYKKGNWVISGMLGIVGGGGKASFDEGLPMFDSKVMAAITSATGGKVTPDMYTINSSVQGRQYVYGGQLGFTYRVNKKLSLFAGGRMDYFSGNYTGYVIATMTANKQELANLQLNCDQTGWGITPIIGIDYKIANFTLAAKYEFMTNLNIENNTKVNSDPNGALADYEDGVNTPNDIPSLLSVAVGYAFTPRFRATAEYHFYDDKRAQMAHIDGGTYGKQKALTHGTSEVLLGAEYDVTKRITLSAGAQRTDYGLSDKFQTNTAFYCDSYSIGLGGAIKLTPRVKLNIGYFWTNYSDYKKEVAAGADGGYNGTTLAGTDNYSRTNKVFGVGVDYHF
jgi:long-chain fatty acid transport protein